jgi:hypothetical protein
MLESAHVSEGGREWTNVGDFENHTSKEAYLTDSGSHNLARLMFEVPRMDGAALGADLPNSPVIVGEQNGPEPMTDMIVPVGKWSDGTTAPLE